jgi:type IV pilus assembly protein PilV
MNTRVTDGRFTRAGARGFTLLEVMVALVITSIGLLGIAKIQALAYASTGTAGMRSLVALQAAGLATAMHADRGYWAAGGAPTSVVITGTAISDNTLNTTAATPGYCVAGNGNTPCLPATMAAYDLHTYANALNAMLGNSNPVTTITCPATVIGQPTNCTVLVSWSEKAVAINAQGQAANVGAGSFSPSYMLYVTP